MGAMAAATDFDERERDARQRLAWERRHRDKDEFLHRMKDNAPRSALSARAAEDPLLGGVADGGDPLAPLASFAEEKTELQDEMTGGGEAAADEVAEAPKAAFQPTKISTGAPARTVAAQRGERPSRAATFAAAKSAELVARAGAGDAFQGAALGVGGLDDVLARIRRRVWVPLAAPPGLLRDLGIAPVRGLLL